MSDRAHIDLDAPPLTDGQLAEFRPRPLARRVRQTLALSQEAFAERYGIPVGTLREWEQSRREPDTTAVSYLTAIMADPDGVAHALATGRAA
jgi:Predicted transcriptional regulator